MSTAKLFRGSAIWLLAVLFTACGPEYGSRSGNADPYNGLIDNSVGAPPFTGVQTTPQGALANAIQPFVAPTTADRTACGGLASCYFETQGFAAGQPFHFFIAGNVADTTPSAPFIPTCKIPGFTCAYSPDIAVHQNDGGGGFSADVFPHSCAPVPFNAVTDAFRRDQQFPLVSALPLNNSSNSGARPPVGAVAVHSVSGVSGEACNDIKYFESVGVAGSPGRFGSVQSSQPVDFQVWMIFDPLLPVFSKDGRDPGNTQLLSPGTFWFRGLQGNYLSGGSIPLDASGNLVAMDGVILDPAGSTAFEVPTTRNAVLLPVQPGSPGFSPIVRLHDFRLPSGATLGSGTTPPTFTGVCPIGAATCDTAHNVDLSRLPANAFNTLFIVASPQ